MKKLFKKLAARKDGFGLNEILGIAAALIIAALVIIPGLSNFAGDVMGDMNTWWTSIGDKIFISELPVGP